jgi:hypothetical protein
MGTTKSHHVPEPGQLCIELQTKLRPMVTAVELHHHPKASASAADWFEIKTEESSHAFPF